MRLSVQISSTRFRLGCCQGWQQALKGTCQQVLMIYKFCEVDVLLVAFDTTLARWLPSRLLLHVLRSRRRFKSCSEKLDMSWEALRPFASHVLMKA